MGKRRSSPIPYEIVEEILIRLPIRSLVRLKAVSKDVCAIISSPSFIGVQYQNSKTNPSFIIRSSNDPYRVPPQSSGRFFLCRNRTAVLQVHDPGWYHRVVRMVGCANGLVCVELAFCGSARRTFTLWNPATKQYRHVWYPAWGTDDYTIVGFGYHGGIKDYKLFAMAPLQDHARVISLRHRTSRQIDTPGRPLLITGDVCGPGVCVKGVWYRVVSIEGSPIILSFDLKEDSFAVIDFPLTTDTRVIGVELSVQDDEKLCLFAAGSPSGQAHGWTLMCGGGGGGGGGGGSSSSSSSWARMFTIHYRTPYPTPLRFYCRLGSPSFEDTRLLLWDYYDPEYYLDVIKGIFLWDPLTPSSDKIPKTIQRLDSLQVSEACDLVESLVSPFLLEL